MVSYQSFTQDERNAILAKMSERQKEFLMSTLKRSRATAFANTLLMTLAETKHAATHLFTESADLIESDWELVEIIDAGQVTDSLKCECGRSLRYQYTVKNNLTGETLKLGKTHLALHMGIPEHIAQAVINNLMQIDFELDEILEKYQAKFNKAADDPMNSYWENYLFLFDETIVKQFELGIPFLDSQINKLSNLISEHQKETQTAILKAEAEEELQQFFEKKRNSHALNHEDQVSFRFEQNTGAAQGVSFSTLLDKQSLSNERKEQKAHWTDRMKILSSIERSDLYHFDLYDDILICLKQGINSANAIIEQLLQLEKYQLLFASCTNRMCYILVTGRITAAILNNEPITRESRGDRQDTYYFLTEQNV
ncbi:hypothetical protein [Solibacillus sp. NPDC093137]|uniref:hypothetical protein n=1 Tax=Solibacillus sp. NPDC093137 TaxID=3390678 RepID=UPI003D030290